MAHTGNTNTEEVCLGWSPGHVGEEGLTTRSPELISDREDF